jgi:DNA repair protein RecO (recombination protein O)
MPLYNVEAINLRSRNFGEADKIITLFSREKGKIQAIAKGSRRPTSKFGGRLEVFSHNSVMLATGRSLDIISQCETIDSFFRLREEREKLNTGFYMVKLVDIITEDRQVNVELFDLLLEGLRTLEKGLNGAALPRIFEAQLSEVEGIMPSDEMLERKYKGLPAIIEKFRFGFRSELSGLTERDLNIAGKVMRELISDHTDFDLRKLKVII